MILLTGASGFLGKIMFRIFSLHSDTVGLSFSQSGQNFRSLDLTDSSAVLSLLNDLNPSVVVHSAAWRDPDRCEQFPDGARALHVDATALLARWCADHNACLVYISSDYVFDGSNPPYHEDDPPSPVNVYGATKAAGESAARFAPGHIIARIPLQYGFSCVPDDSFLLKVIGQLNNKSQLIIDNYQYRYPTLSDDIARALIALITSKYTGTIHLRADSRLTRYQMWLAIADVFERSAANCKPAPQPVHQIASRPADSQLALERFHSQNLSRFHDFHEGLTIVRQQMSSYGYDWRT